MTTAPHQLSALRDHAVTLNDAIHDLAQPLTTLSFALELSRDARANIDADRLASEVDRECRRAFERLEAVRSVAALLLHELGKDVL